MPRGADGGGGGSGGDSEGGGGDGGGGGGGGDALSTYMTVMIGDATDETVTPSAAVAADGDATIVSSVIWTGVDVPPMVTMVAVTTIEPAVTLRAMDEGGTPSAEARAAIKLARSKLAGSMTEEIANVVVKVVCNDWPGGAGIGDGGGGGGGGLVRHAARAERSCWSRVQ